MKKLVIPILLIIALAALVYFVQEQKPARLANPSAVYCVDRGFEYKIRTGPSGAQDGYCIFPDGSECPGWDYYYGKCFPSQTKFEDYFKITTFQQCADAGYPIMESYPRQCRTPDGRMFREEITEPQLIGGQRDEHGCLGPAGYSWNAEVGACIRAWELNEDTMRAAQIAATAAGQEYGLTINEVIILRCPGCFQVTLSDTEHKITEVTLEDWKVKSVR